MGKLFSPVEISDPVIRSVPDEKTAVVCLYGCAKKSGKGEFRQFQRHPSYGDPKMQDDEKFFDVRVYERYVKEGSITKKDYERYVKSLPDVGDKAETLVIEEKTGKEDK